MMQETKDYINEIAERIINYCDVKLPVENINDIVKNLGGTVVESDVHDDVCDWVAMKTGENSFTINVAKHQDAYRKTKSIASALGHVIMHMGFMTNPQKWRFHTTNMTHRFVGFLQNEQAIAFTMALLMPKNEYLRVIGENAFNNIVNMDAVAKYFNVSIYDAINRGRILGVLACLP
jgi:hypothetical protein